MANSAARLSGNTAYTVWGVEFWANGVPKSTTAQPNLYVGDAKVATSAQSAMNIGGLGDLTIAFGKHIYFKNTPAEGETAISVEALRISTNNNLMVGYGFSGNGYDSIFYGNTLYFRYGTQRTNGLVIDATAITGHRDIVPNANATRNLGSSSLFWKYAYAQRIYLTSSVYIEYVDNSGNGYVYINAPLVTDGDQIVKSGTPGGGGGGGATFLNDLEDVTITSAANGDVLRYNGSKWVNVASTEVGITDAGSVADLNASTPTNAKKVWSPSVLADWLSGKNYITGADAVSNVAIGTSDHAQDLAVTKNGTTSYLTVPYATTVTRLVRCNGTAASGGYDLNTMLAGGGITSNYGSENYWANKPTGMSYGGAVQLNTQVIDTLCLQLAWDVKYSAQETGKIWWRDKYSTSVWGSWHLIYDNASLLLNGAAGNDAALTFFAPTSAGTADQVLLSGGAGVAPRWANQSSLAAGSATSDGDGNTISSTYLKLSGGEMSGDITLPSGKYIRLNSSTELLGLTSGGVFYCGPGYDVSSNFLLRTGDIDLIHRKYTGASAYTDYKIYDASNANLSTIDWAAKDLAAAGNISATGTATSSRVIISATTNVKHIEFTRGGYNWLAAPESGVIAFAPGGVALSSGNAPMVITSSVVRPGANETYTLGNSSYRWANVFSKEAVLVAESGAAVLNIRSTAVNTDAGTIMFRCSAAESNGFKIVGTSASSYSRISLDFFCSDVHSGSAPYTPDWKRAMQIKYDGTVTFGESGFTNDVITYGAVGIGTTSLVSGAKLTVNGVIASTGDQVVTSDIRMKTNLKPIELSVEQIAKCRAVTFDWTTGGHSFGSIAQDWADILPEAVHKGDTLSLAYAQLGTVIGITLAKHETEQDKEIRVLKAKVKNLEEEVKRLRAN